MTNFRNDMPPVKETHCYPKAEACTILGKPGKPIHLATLDRWVKRLNLRYKYKPSIGKLCLNGRDILKICNYGEVGCKGVYIPEIIKII